MPTVHIASAGDVLDAICARHYGTAANPRRFGAMVWPEPGLVELVYRANRGLAALGSSLPAGHEVILPDAPPKPAVKRVQLWE